ncbi:hypothetical protein D3C83_170870 [compost metagenome]
MLRGTSPTFLLRIPDTHPVFVTELEESTPRAATVPFVHYYRVLAADDCETEQAPP